eukprot:COSAG03_NODE_160_length_11366_cov_10.057518_6_plen_80_part_00
MAVDVVVVGGTPAWATVTVVVVVVVGIKIEDVVVVVVLAALVLLCVVFWWRGGDAISPVKCEMDRLRLHQRRPTDKRGS